VSFVLTASHMCVMHLVFTCLAGCPWCEIFPDDTSDILELSALDWAAVAERMGGDGSRGSYDQILKSADFFSISLQAPDREFHHMFRYELIYLHALS
jgi:hypothetical protein